MTHDIRLVRGCALEIPAGYGSRGSQLFTRLQRKTNENFGFQPDLGINGLPGFSGEESAGPPAAPD